MYWNSSYRAIKREGLWAVVNPCRHEAPLTDHHRLGTANTKVFHELVFQALTKAEEGDLGFQNKKTKTLTDS